MQDKSETATERNVARLGEEAFESAVEMQMNMVEAASRFAVEISTFASRRAGTNATDLARLASAKSPQDLVEIQVERMRRMYRDYSEETDRLFSLTQDVVKESSAAIQATAPQLEDLREAG